MTVDALTREQAWAIVREDVRDKSYQLFPMGMEAAAYLRQKRRRLTASSYRDYECCLDKMARFFGPLEIRDFEPPIGMKRVEEFLDKQWGDCQPRTYNKNLSIIGDFFDWEVRSGNLHGDPTTAIERAKARGVYRETFTDDQIRAIIVAQDDIRDKLALRLILWLGIRKGGLQTVQFRHFDHLRQRITVLLKGGKLRELPIPDPAFWHELERHIMDVEAEPHHYLMARQKRIPHAGMRRFPELPMGAHGLHSWWYRCLANAGITAVGQEKGEKMHKGRHTAGQRLLDSTGGNLKAVQKLLCHESIQTTADVYVDWDIDQLRETMSKAFAEGGLE